MEISIVIINYNYGKYLSRAIRSVLTQSFNKNEREIIVVDDASTDNSKETMELYQEQINGLYHSKNVGIAESCNEAFKWASGKYVIRLDADDYVHTDWLKLHHLFLSNNKGEIHATSSDYLEVDLNENTIKRRNGDTFPIACGIMYKLDDVFELGLYNTNIPREDIEFRQRFLKSGKYLYNIPVPLYRYTQHSESFTKNYSVQQG